MRTLLRHTGTGLYFQGPDKWIANPDSAYDFRFIDRAVSFAATWELREVELAFAFEGAEAVTTVPLEKTAVRFAEV
jgi:hypothetical protein